MSECSCCQVVLFLRWQLLWGKDALIWKQERFIYCRYILGSSVVYAEEFVVGDGIHACQIPDAVHDIDAETRHHGAPVAKQCQAAKEVNVSDPTQARVNSSESCRESRLGAIWILSSPATVPRR